MNFRSFFGIMNLSEFANLARPAGRHTGNLLQPLGDMADLEHTARRKKRKDRLDVSLSNTLRTELRKIEANYDVILIDCPAGPGVLGLAALRLAQHILAPTSLETNAYSTLTDFLEFILADDLDLASHVKVHPLICVEHNSA